ncbi:hypothetical protein ES692_05995 [Psychroserpens burtonensis]|uniref:Uncharacterized protein n=1 Tax=Psychroserpens burtonensis TaxID=49278 RepID=A0A5C7BHZ7_9FLAO|nr:hypothetical protein [Psychroserpens burtonensis]TXE18592.1 hypothetical protein ES692_05995 [Psychroserpens burtonensis]
MTPTEAKARITHILRDLQSQGFTSVQRDNIILKAKSKLDQRPIQSKSKFLQITLEDAIAEVNSNTPN